MKRRERLPELLAPAGSADAFYAAVEAGADAVYLGISEGSSNARVGAENFTRESLFPLIPYAHAQGVKVYLTLNTMTFENELADRLSLARYAFEAGVDALIVADLGLAARLARELPEMPIHASTQCFTHSTATADALYRLGFSRVVLAREMTGEDIARVTRDALAEVEIFLHGALCVSHSGECLFSSVLGGRSGNRGACAQPCRKAYGKAGYALSLKDACLAAHIPSLIDSGVASLKIEGRMKSASYVYTVTRVYRRLLDEGRAATEQEMRELANAFSRSGFTDGYYIGKLGGMTGIRTEKDKLASRKTEEYHPSPLPIPVESEAIYHKDEPIRLTLSMRLKNGRTLTATAEGEKPLAAENAALTHEGVTARLSKLGAEGMRMTALSLSLDEGLFVPVGLQNALKREAAAALLENLRLEREPNPVSIAPKEEATLPFAPLRTAVYYRKEGYHPRHLSAFDIVFLPHEAFESQNGATGVIIPPVTMPRDEAELLPLLRRAKENGALYALVSSLGAIALAKEAGLVPVGDHRFNAANAQAVQTLRRLGLYHLILSLELPPSRAKHLSGGFLVYGRIPLMLTERCFVKENGGCGICGKAALTDERGARFPMMRVYPHRTLILNSLPTYLGDKPSEMPQGLGKHFIFSTESEGEIDEIIAAERAGAPLPFPVRRAYK